MGEQTRSGMRKLAAIVMVAVLPTIVLQGAEATTYTVGDAVTWRVPPSTTTYSNWSSSYTFEVGDVLVFNFVTGQHDVAEVTEADFNSCNTGSPMQLLTNGPTNFNLNETKTYYFICTFSNHCGSGQKVAVATGASSGPTPSPPGTTTITPSPLAPPGSGSTSLTATSKLILLSLAIAMGFM